MDLIPYQTPDFACDERGSSITMAEFEQSAEDYATILAVAYSGGGMPLVSIGIAIYEYPIDAVNYSDSATYEALSTLVFENDELYETISGGSYDVILEEYGAEYAANPLSGSYWETGVMLPEGAPSDLKEISEIFERAYAASDMESLEDDQPAYMNVFFSYLKKKSYEDRFFQLADDLQTPNATAILELGTQMIDEISQMTAGEFRTIHHRFMSLIEEDLSQYEV